MSLLGRFLNVDGSILLFIPLAHVLARVIQVGAVKTRTVVGHTAGREEPGRATSASSSRRSSSPSRACSRRSSTAPRPRPRPTARARSSTRPPRWPSTGRAPRTPAAPGLALRPSTRCSTSWSTASCAPPSAAAAWARSPAAPRSATGSATSSAASASPSTRATASPRPPPPRRSTTTRRCASAPSAGRCPASTSAIADDGEVLIRGGIVMRGYWKNEEATKEAIDAEGCFHTGDLGELDGDGFLKITGRKKEILVTAGGKNVAPAVLEDRLRAHRLVSQCIVVGDQRPVHRRADHPRRGGAAAAGWSPRARPGGHTAEQLQRRPGPAGRDRRRGEGRQQGGLPGRGDQEVPRPRHRLHRGQRDADAEPEAQAGRRHEGVRRRGRGALRR